MEATSFRRRVALLAVALLGVLLLAPPILDIWQDWTQPPFKPLWSTLLENITSLVLPGVLVLGSVWLARRDWKDRYVYGAAEWAIAIVVGHAVVLGWILFQQAYVQGDLKPYFIAMDGIVLSADVALGVGVYNARSRRNRDRLERERDRLSALYENSTDPIATVRFDGDAIVEAANGAFRERFGEGVADVLADAPREMTADTVRESGVDGTLEYEWDAGDDRDYRVSVTPIDADDDADEDVRVHVRVADITDQTELVREAEARERLEHLHRVASDLASVDTADSAYERALNALRSTIAFDEACVVVDGDTVAGRGAETTLDRTGIERVQTGAVPSDGGAITRTVDGGETVLTVPVGDDAVLQAGVTESSLRDSQVTAAELLGTHLRETRQRLDREDRLRDQRERLELLNRTFRHDLMNDANVIDARASLLGEHVDETGAEYLATVQERAGEMGERIETMRSLMKAVEGEDHDLTPMPAATAMKAQVDDARGTYRGAAFEVEAPLPDVDVLADDLLADVFQNLLANAVEHNTADAPHVRISAERDGEDLLVTVADNGSGVDPDRRDAVFDLGEKGEASGGTGIGLNICKRIVDSYGGDITITEADDLGGAAFTVRLPIVE
ncbi:signal-transducing histidine kinase [Halarchaeum acidiphilum MH1-52-1]|uniref:histidine kinase n=1 Tax=Halarchaeum acidiphilum MH1-52-1 TaxID=1261545 RepID=U2YF67_9EURY|nr:signal-transducing histidine kinase [Halarchaeum acidiphilum MH1-52-1]